MRGNALSLFIGVQKDMIGGLGEDTCHGQMMTIILSSMDEVGAWIILPAWTSRSIAAVAYGGRGWGTIPPC